MIRSYYLFLAGFLAAAAISGCEDSGAALHGDVFVKYGTSFGECLGYCRKSITITGDQIEFEALGWDLGGGLPDKTASEPAHNKYWVSLEEKIDFNAFFQLDSVIGCPDCADGGAEWIEITKDGKTHRVTFEYWHEPETCEAYISYLRAYLNAFIVDSLESVDFNNRILIDQQGTIRAFVCTRGCYQYLIEMDGPSGSALFMDKYLSPEYQTEGMQIRFNGILQNDSTIIFKPAPNDIPVEDFRVQNIRTFIF